MWNRFWTHSCDCVFILDTLYGKYMQRATSVLSMYQIFVVNKIGPSSRVCFRCLACLFSLLTTLRDSVAQGWGLLSQFPPFRYFPHFSGSWKHRLFLNITFIFDRWRRSSAAATPVKYEWDSTNVTDTFARLQISLTEKLTNGALVTPTPGDSILYWNKHLKAL